MPRRPAPKSQNRKIWEKFRSWSLSDARPTGTRRILYPCTATPKNYPYTLNHVLFLFLLHRPALPFSERTAAAVVDIGAQERRSVFATIRHREGGGRPSIALPGQGDQSDKNDSFKPSQLNQSSLLLLISHFNSHSQSLKTTIATRISSATTPRPALASLPHEPQHSPLRAPLPLTRISHFLVF